MYGLVTASRQPAQAPLNGSVEVSELWLILRHRWPWILGSISFLVTIAILYGLLTPTLFTSTAQILIDSRAKQVMRDENPEAVASDGGLVKAESQARVVESSSVLLRAIAATDLANDPEFNGPSFLRRVLAPLIGRFEPTKASETQARTLMALRRVLAVKRADKVLVIEIVVTTKSADKSAKIANAIAEAYLLDQSEANAALAMRASEDLTARLDGQRQRVEEAENAVERYKADNQIVSSTGQLVVEQQLTEANAQFAAARSRSMGLKSQVDQLNRLRRAGGALDATADAIQSNVIGSLRQQEAALIELQSDLQSQYGPRYPRIAAVDNQLRNLHKLIAAELGRIEQASRSQYELATANERQITDNVDRLKNATLANNQASIRLRELERDLEASRSIYAAYLVRAQESREQANLTTTTARLISRALAAPEKSWPLIGLLLFGAICAGLGIGLALAFVAEYLSPRLVPAQRFIRSGPAKLE
jgi:polysaccharide biosynthesis transport protein